MPGMLIESTFALDNFIFLLPEATFNNLVSSFNSRTAAPPAGHAPVPKTHLEYPNNL
jgi:hypothetical protein